MESKLYVIKVGSNVIANGQTGLDIPTIEQLCRQIAQLRRGGNQVVFVTSGAVAAGKQIRPDLDTNNRISRRQVYSALGQVALLNVYNDTFAKYDVNIAQILVTRDDFSGRDHYLNIRNCITGLLNEGILPVVNENDTVAIEELMFTDNDELAGRIASMMGADELVLLSTVEGLMTDDPDNPAAELVKEIHPGDRDASGFVKSIKSTHGRGGMRSKFNAAMKAAAAGTSCWLGNGKKEGILLNLANGESIGTHFLPAEGSSQKQRWLAFEFPVDAAFVVNDGCKAALLSDETATSLLAVGVVDVKEQFNKGEVVRIEDEQGTMIGYGMAAVSSTEAKENLGQKGIKPFIHYDYLYLENGSSN